jgi:23S rRNA pseudouridine2605 synthase
MRWFSKSARGGGKAVRLARALSKRGAMSRSLAAEAVRAGRVGVNGKTVTDPEFRIDPARDTIALDGNAVQAREPIYLLLNKPVDVVTTRSDERGRKTVYDLIGEASKLAPPVGQWVFPVGRLDRESAGLLLLTNDTALGERLTNPTSKVPKTYRVKVTPVPPEDALERLRQGVKLDDGHVTLPAQVEVERTNPSSVWLLVTIVEGKNRQVRRMVKAVGARVETLVRVAIGPVKLGDLAPGALRPLSPDELAALRGA